MRKILLAALVTTCLAPVSALAQTSYPLVCKGGPGMRIMVNHDVPDGVNTGTTHMTVFFRAAANAGAPARGECVWLDRTFRTGEPENFSISGDVEFSFQVKGNGRVAQDGSGWRLNPEGSGAEAADWTQIVNGILNGGMFTVQVYNASGRTMAVTAVGP